jgi:hypothetical protein
MPILVIAVVAFIIFNILMALVISAVITEQRKQKRDRVLSDIAALDPAPAREESSLKPA